MSLEARGRVGLDRFPLDMDLRVAGGEVLAVLGPNGAGKSSLLRCIAGLLPLDSGVISLSGVPLDQPAQGRFVPPERRRVGFCFQDHRLFPNLDVLGNVAFGPRAQGLAPKHAAARAAAWLERLGLDPLASTAPARLSGGQAQAVALARTLAADPLLLLLDEPTASLDQEAGRSVRRLLAQVLADFSGPTLLVSHQPLDCVALADRVLVMEAGQPRLEGSLEGLRAAGGGAFGAEVLDQNWLRGHLAEGRLSVEGGTEWACAQLGLSGPVYASIRPQAITLHRQRPEGSARNCFEAPIAEIWVRPDGLRLRLGPPLSLLCQITAAAQAEMNLVPGERVWAAIKASDIDCHPR